MKSIQIKRYGNSDVVEVNDNVSIPSVSAGKILVNVKASGVNPADWKIREGYFQQMAPLQFPSTLGLDFSGVVKQIGEEDMSPDFKQGDEVYGQASVLSGGSGTFAELASANKDSIAHKPKTLNHPEAAALPLVGVSAWQALVENIELANGQKILSMEAQEA
jgi:alcohol dehydrogenase